MTLAKERNHTELKKFFADHLGQIHKDSGTLFAPQSSFLDTALATVPDQNASDKAQDQTKVQTEMSEFSKVCEKQSASCGLKRGRVSIQEATAPDLKSLRSRSHRVDQSEFSDLVFTAPATGPDELASALESKFPPDQQANPSQEATSADLKSLGLEFRYHLIDQSHFSDFVFTSLSDAIRLWEDSRDEKVRNSLPKFNILATVIKWNEPKKTKGVNYSHLIAHETDMWFQGSDMHVAATLHSSECNGTIKASFFFDPEYVPKPCLVGEQIRLIGARLQLWKGCLQLTGKNIRFGQPLVSMTLSNAIAAWRYVTGVQPLLFIRKNTTKAQRCFPKLTLIVNVKMWGNATTTTGAPILNIVLTLYYIRFIRVARW
jgi:hypothetical protein